MIYIIKQPELGAIGLIQLCVADLLFSACMMYPNFRDYFSKLNSFIYTTFFFTRTNKVTINEGFRNFS